MRASIAGAASPSVADAQRHERIGNFVARLHHPRSSRSRTFSNAILSLFVLAKS